MTLTGTVLERMASRDASAMDECMERYGGLVWTLVQRRCGNRADAEDVTQDVFLDLWKSAHRFDPALGSEATFIAMVTRRRLIDRQRRQQTGLESVPLTEGLEPAHAETTCFAEVLDEASYARELMGQLKEEERSVLQLAIDEGLSQGQIAARVRLPLGTVKTHARRGMLRLRELFLARSAGELRGGAS